LSGKEIASGRAEPRLSGGIVELVAAALTVTATKEGNDTDAKFNAKWRPVVDNRPKV